MLLPREKKTTSDLSCCFRISLYEITVVIKTRQSHSVLESRETKFQINVEADAFVEILSGV